MDLEDLGCYLWVLNPTDVEVDSIRATLSRPIDHACLKHIFDIKNILVIPVQSKQKFGQLMHHAIDHPDPYA